MILKTLNQSVLDVALIKSERMVIFIMVSKIINVRTVAASLLKITVKNILITLLKNILITYYLKEYLWLAYVEFLRSDGTWLQKYVNAKYAEVSRELEVSAKSLGKLSIQCDELWSYVQNKENQQWWGCL
ncbi:hypothetical protein Oscil6304_4541 [Oscillatoria acuminata PCC 6304]|uniref:Uncharacterized protein n=1 Tax=Oscillatoria acuminata PCC 6304 TaxID=56110 RepID=K9TMG8_9CYAN|nr:hypothetical protein Oscil6304_4541 [Oscillatoria acuminata PCC 6304]